MLAFHPGLPAVPARGKLKFLRPAVNVAAGEVAISESFCTGAALSDFGIRRHFCSTTDWMGRAGPATKKPPGGRLHAAEMTRSVLAACGGRARCVGRSVARRGVGAAVRRAGGLVLLRLLGLLVGL